MNKILSLSAAAALLCLTSAGAHAEGGCGRDFHRGENGRCFPNEGRVIVVPAPVVVVPGGVVCGPGLRWHPGRHRCWAY